MKDSRGEDSGPSGLDDNLFIMMNGAPMKFYLLGYDMDTSRRMTEIIEALGGKSSELNATDTFVFCERDHPLRAGEHNRYDIRYLYDSVVALEPQKLENYKLHVHSNEQVFSVIEDEELIHVKSEEEEDDESEGSCNSKLSMISDQQWSSAVDYQFEKLHCNEDNNNRDKRNNINDPSSTEYHNEDSDSDTSWTVGIPRVNSLKTDRLDEHECHDSSEDEQSLDEDEEKSFSEDEEDSDGSEDEHVKHEDTDEVIDVESDGSGRSSEEEEGFDGSDDEQKTDSCKYTNDDLSMEVDEEEECVNSSDNTGDSDGSDPSQSTNASVASSHRNSPKAQGIKKSPKRIIFTEEEDEKIIRFVIKKNVIPKDFAKTIWTDMLEEKVLGNCSVSYQVLARHYRQNLKSHPTFKNFIKNFDKKQKFTKNESKTRIFSAYENRKIMRWIIRKNVIPTDYGTSIWNDMLRENVLKNCSVSSRDLSQHYRQQLKHHPNFMEYVKRSTASQRSKQVEQKPQTTTRGLMLWTEEEDRILIQYLIDNDVIHKGKSLTVWKNCWEVNKSSFAPTRSENSLRMRFSSYLSNNYSKFTNDPKVLKKFQKLEQASRKSMK